MMSRITLKQVAQAASVSVQTVSHILNELPDKPYKPETRRRVFEVAKQLGYRPNAAARSMVTQRTHNVGLIMPVKTDAWFSSVDTYETMMGLNVRLSPRGYVCSVIPVKQLNEPGSESRIFREQVLDGVVVYGAANPEVYERIEKSIDLCIWVDTDMDRPTGCIRRDEKYNSYLAACKLAGLGYRKLIWLDYAVHASHYSHEQRYAGFEQAVREFDLTCDHIACSAPWIGHDPHKLLRKLTPDVAVIANRHQFALSLSHIMRHVNKQPGYDFGLVALEKSHECANTWPGLSAVVTDRAQIGELAARMFLEANGKPRQLPESVCIQGQWHAGETAWGPR
jgi:DNA-binding LacI/PurR family transcriptional regulator